VKGRVSKINQVKEYVSKNDQLQCIKIAVDLFLLLLFFLSFFQMNAFAIKNIRKFPIGPERKNAKLVCNPVFL